MCDSKWRVVAPLTSRADALSTPVMFVPLERLLGDAGGVLKICTGEKAAARDVSHATHFISTRGGALISIRAAVLNGGFRLLTARYSHSPQSTRNAGGPSARVAPGSYTCWREGGVGPVHTKYGRSRPQPERMGPPRLRGGGEGRNPHGSVAKIVGPRAGQRRQLMAGITPGGEGAA